MSTETTGAPAHNGTPPAPAARVRFGPRPTETLPAEWVEPILTWIKAHHPLVFAGAIQHGVLGIDGRARDAAREH